MPVSSVRWLGGAILLLCVASCTSSTNYRNSDVEPVSREQIRAIQLLLDGGDAGRAQAQLRELAVQFPASVEVQRTLQELYRQELSDEEFIARYRAGAEARPSDSISRYLLGRALVIIAEDAAAQAEFEEAARLDPRGPWPRIGLGYMHRKRGDMFKTVEIYRSALDAAPRSARLRWFLGTLYMDLRLYVDAQRELQIADRLDPGNPEVWAALGRTHMGMKNYDAAWRELLRAREGMPEQVGLYPALTELYLHQRCPQQAAESYRTGLDYGMPPAPDLEGRVRALQLVAGDAGLSCRQPSAR